MWNPSQYLPAHSCGSVSATVDSNGFCHLCLCLQSTHIALGHPWGSSGSPWCLKNTFGNAQQVIFVCTLKRHNYRSQQAEGAPFKHSPVKTKTKSATPTHSKPKPLNHVVFNSCRDDGKHMHLERIHHHTDAHTFNNYFWNGTRGELHSHLMRKAEDFRLWNSRRADPILGGAWWGWCG